jgi:hypothetical protein
MNIFKFFSEIRVQSGSGALLGRPAVHGGALPLLLPAGLPLGRGLSQPAHLSLGQERCHLSVSHQSLDGVLDFFD